MSSPRSSPSSERLAAVRVRAAQPADAYDIARVHRESWRTTYAGILTERAIGQLAGRKTESVWRQALAREAGVDLTWVAEMRGEGVVGFASCGPARHEAEGLDAEIYALYVLQGQQRRGAGRALVREAARHFVRHGLFGFYVWVLKANKARLFYEALGGTEIDQRCETIGGQPVNQVAYGWHDLTGLVAPT